MTEELKSHVASLLYPDRGIVLFAKDHGRGPKLAELLRDYLENNGFAVNGFIAGDFGIDVEKQLTVFKEGLLVQAYINIFGKNQVIVIDTSV